MAQNLILIDLISNTGRVAIASAEGQLLASRVWENERSHAEFLVHHIEDCLSEAGKTYADISKIGVINGPGSFTGIRVAISCAKALQISLNVPVVCVNTLAVWGKAAAYCLPSSAPIGALSPIMGEGNSPIIIAQDVRRNELAVQIFSPAGEPFSDMRHASVDQIELPEGAFFIAGSGAQSLIARFGADRLKLLNISDEHVLTALAQLTITTSSNTEIAPFYIRPSDAQLPKAMLTFTHV